MSETEYIIEVRRIGITLLRRREIWEATIWRTRKGRAGPDQLVGCERGETYDAAMNRARVTADADAAVLTTYPEQSIRYVPEAPA